MFYFADHDVCQNMHRWLCCKAQNSVFSWI